MTSLNKLKEENIISRELFLDRYFKFLMDVTSDFFTELRNIAVSLFVLGIFLYTYYCNQKTELLFYTIILIGVFLLVLIFFRCAMIYKFHYLSILKEIKESKLKSKIRYLFYTIYLIPILITLTLLVSSSLIFLNGAIVLEHQNKKLCVIS